MKDNVVTTVSKIYDALRGCYPPPEWIYIPELRTGTGFAAGAEQRIDLWVMSCYPSNEMWKIAFEIKVSRSDFLRELKEPVKRKLAMEFSNQFYFVAPKGVVKTEELPLDCGFMRYEEGQLKIVSSAPTHQSLPPTWGLLASVARRTE